MSLLPIIDGTDGYRSEMPFVRIKNQNRLFGMAAMHAGFAQLQQNTNTSYTIKHKIIVKCTPGCKLAVSLEK